MNSIEIRLTPYGGRGYFAKENIQKGSVILRCDHPFASTVFRRFRKEVCAYCFAYQGGKTLKFRLPKQVYGKEKGGAYAGLYFCSQECVNQWVFFEDADDSLSDTLQLVDSAVRSTQTMAGKESEVFHGDVPLTRELMDEKWRLKIEELSRTSDLKIQNLPHIDEIEHDIARLVVTTLVKKFRVLSQDGAKVSTAQTEWDKFSSLQSNEYFQIIAYHPYMTAYLRTFEFLHKVLPPKFKNVFTASVLRDTVGIEAGNAFGIWELPLNLESECFGTSIRPLASYFNHQCEPTVKKERNGRSMIFTTVQDIPAGQELYICYGMMEDMSFEERSKILSDQWHFKCNCKKCELKR
jgi:hypothetical protein